MNDTRQDGEQPEQASGLDHEKMLRAAMDSSPRRADGMPSAEELSPSFPDFLILEPIGFGGMGQVYKAVHKKLDRVVALKILPQALAQDPAFEERFHREARALAQLNHPGVLTVHDFGESGGYFYIVAEYVDGMNLRELLHMGRLAPEEAFRYVPQICDALQFAHDHGVVHRDIKPENILIDAFGQVRIADFGLAKLVGVPASMPALTETRQVLGTPHYMAPEQIDNPERVDHRADIFSLGVVIYEMLTGQLPLGRFEPPSSRAKVGHGVDEAVMRSLSREPGQRYSSVDEVKRAVEAKQAVEGAQVLAEPTASESTESVPSESVSTGVKPRFHYKPLLVLIMFPVLSAALVFTFFVAASAPVPHDPESSGVGSESPQMVWISLSYILGFVALIGTLLLPMIGFAAIRRIRNSGGLLYGYGPAVILAWILPILVVNGGLISLMAEVRDGDLRQIGMVVLILILVIADIIFLHWQMKRAAGETRHARRAS